VVDIVFSRWTTPILWTLNEYGRQRFVELQRRIPTITPKVLTQRLRQLERDGLVQRTDRGLRAHGDGDDLVDRDGATLLDLHGRLDGVRVIRVEVLLTAAIQTTRGGVDALLDGGVRDFLDQHGDLHGVSASSGERTIGMVPLSLTDESIGRGDRTAPVFSPVHFLGC